MTWRGWVGRVQVTACGRYRVAMHGNRHYAVVFAGYRRDYNAPLQSLGRFDRHDTATNVEAARQACAQHAGGSRSGGRHG